MKKKKKDRKKLIPALVMLIGGAAYVPVAWFKGLSFLDFTKGLLICLLIFYVLGCIFKEIADRAFPLPVEEEKEPENPEGTPEGEEGEEREEAEENVNTEDYEEAYGGETGE